MVIVFFYHIELALSLKQIMIDIFLYMILGEHIKNWRKRYFILRKDGSFLGFRAKPEHGLSDPLNDFTVRGKIHV